MLRTVLLSIHLLAVIIWLGVGLYELFLRREIRQARGLPQEIALMRIYGRYAGIVAIATLVVAGAGMAMSLYLGWGFFSVLWLGIKQGIMATIILGMAVLTPLFMRTYEAIESISENDASGLAAVRTLLRRIEKYLVLILLGGLVAVITAVWRPA